MQRIGILMRGLQCGTSLERFYRGLHQLDYVVGKNVAIEVRYANSNAHGLSVLAVKKTCRPQSGYYCCVEHTCGLAAKQATSTIPIVAALMADPIADDLVTSLARPSANVTGTTFLAPKLVAKRLQLLRDAIPKLSRVAALWHPHAYGARTMDEIVRDIEEGVRILGMTLQLAPVADSDGLDDAFSAIVKEHVDAFIVLPSPMLFGQYKRIVAFAANNRLPAMYQSREFVDAGGLM